MPCCDSAEALCREIPHPYPHDSPAQRLPVPRTRRAGKPVEQETVWKNLSGFKNVFTLYSLNQLFNFYSNELQNQWFGIQECLDVANWCSLQQNLSCRTRYLFVQQWRHGSIVVCVRVGCYVAFRSLKKFLVLSEISGVQTMISFTQRVQMYKLQYRVYFRVLSLWIDFTS